MYILYLFIYLTLCIGRVVEGSISLSNIWCELDVSFTRDIKGQIEIKQTKSYYDRRYYSPKHLDSHVRK